MARALAILVGVGLLGAVQWYQWQHQPIAIKVANKLLGETWYRIELNGLHTGFMHNLAYKDVQGRYHFNTTTHFRLQPGKPNTVSKQLVFAPEDDYQLLDATYVNRAQETVLSVGVTRADQGYFAQVDTDGHRRSQKLDWQYAISDFVALETWLSQVQPTPGASRLAKNPDFERLTISQQGFRIAEKNATGYLLENDAPLAAHRIQLDQNFRPANLFMSGTFEFVATHQNDAINLDTASMATNYLFASDARIVDHTNVASLSLEFQTSQDIGLDKHLKNTAEFAAQHGAPGDHVQGALRYPLSLEQIQNLVIQRKQAAKSKKDLAYALVIATHQQLRYTENQPAGSVVEALRRGGGECTDFADLFTTMARAADLPARTVYGLVYRDASQPGFVFHAWNEVYFDDAWHAVDPTWNQTRVDATHIRLTDSQAGAFMLAHSRNDLSIRIAELTYFSS